MDKIGPFQILDVLHRGPQSLYRVKAADGRVLALKAAPVADSTPETRERFAREAETCRSLDHPHVARVFESGEADGFLYQAMELLEGADLGKVMGEGRPFTWDEKLAIMEQVCDGLQCAHERHLVHRDIKPANLFLEDSGRVVVLDFGMVRVAESELTKAGAAVGTLNYMAPEQIRGERCTAASDVFSAGIVFYQLATGRHPFSSKDRSLAQVVSAIVFEPPPKLSEICPDAPEGLEFLLTRALEKDAAKRFQDAGELNQALAACRLAISSGPGSGPAAERSSPSALREAQPMAEAEGEKTQVFSRPKATPAGRVDTPQRVGDAPEPRGCHPEAPAPVAGLRFRYCPSCTSANPPDATVCSRCGLPLAESAAAAKSTNWRMYVAVGVVAVLAIALMLALLAKRG